MGGPETWFAAAAGAGALGSIRQGYAQAGAHKYNARALEAEAVAEEQQGVAREDFQRRQAGRVLGAQRAAFAESGGGMGGSAADVMAQSAVDAELDALTLRYESQLRARGMRAEGKLEKYNAKQAKISGYMKAGTSMLSGVGDYQAAR